MSQGVAVINGPSYKESGVDIEAGADLVERIKPLARSTDRAGVMGGLGGFGGLFDPKAAGYDDPVLVAATDGVGTKLKIAIDIGLHDTVGIDLVAMCVNDLVVQGAEPLFFLDYFATGRLDPESAAAVVGGIAEGCRQAGCARHQSMHHCSASSTPSIGCTDRCVKSRASSAAKSSGCGITTLSSSPCSTASLCSAFGLTQTQSSPGGRGRVPLVSIARNAPGAAQARISAASSWSAGSPPVNTMNGGSACGH
ncbi:MAG: hypothetical protein EBU57_08505, partial [Alphaproteobacteria bacterium]|nr:hypothetical protein [Alphaproteobacteria bacterium]